MLMTMKLNVLLTAACLVLLSNLSYAHIEIDGAYVRGLPPGQPNTAAFMRLYNDTSDDMTLIGAETSAAKRVEIHQHSHHNGVMQMRQVHSVDIGAGQVFEFKSGGYHIMLIGLAKPLRHGDTVDFDLVFASGAKVSMTLPVQSVLKEKS